MKFKNFISVTFKRLTSIQMKVCVYTVRGVHRNLAWPCDVSIGKVFQWEIYRCALYPRCCTGQLGGTHAKVDSRRVPCHSE